MTHDFEPQGHVVLDSSDISRALTRLAHEIVERTQGATNLTLMGIPTRGASLATRLGGHLVQGHVDAVGEVSAREHSENWDLVTITPPKELLKYVVEKGSITIDGTSLTVSAVTDTTFSVSLIPATLEKTTLGIRQIGDRVNLEVDVLAKYVEKLVAAR